MMKRLLGILIAVAVIVVIVFTALHHDKYTSMIPSSPSASEEAVTTPVDTASETPKVEIPMEAPVDSVALHAADSVAQ